uniref:Lig_chan-Glu_bd domain-containing protein n=1 Tax=Macrostomum lignano TaxID=282301 RepID=A0A1I8ILG7_9PLAT
TDKHRSAAPVDEALPALRSPRLPHWLSEFADRRRRAKFLETMEQTRNKVGNAQPTLQSSTPGTSNRKNRPDLPFKKSTVPFEKLSQLEKRCRMQMQPSLVPTAQTPSARQSMAVTQSPNPDTVDTGRLRLLASKKATRRSSVPQAKSSASGPQIPQLHCATAGRRQKGPPGAWQDGRDLLAVGDAQAERLLAAASGGARAEKRTAGPPELAQLQQLPAGGQTPHPASSIAASGEHFVSIQAAVTGNKGRSEARASQLGTLAPLSHRRGSRVRALEQSRCAVGGAAQQQAGVTAAADGAGSPAAMSQRRSGGSSRRCGSAPAAAAVRSSAAAAAGVGGDCRCRSFEQDLTAAASAALDVCRGRVHQVNAQRCDRQEAPPGQAETRQGSHSRSGLRAECRSGPGSRSFQLASRQAAPRQLSIVAVIAEANNGQSAGSGAEVQQVGLGQSGGGESGGAEHRGPVQQLSAMMTFFVFVVLDAIIAAAQAPQLKGAIVGDCQQAIVGQVDGEEPGIGEERQTVGDSSSSRYSLPTFHGIAAGVVICALVQVPQGHVILSLASQKSWRYPIVQEEEAKLEMRRKKDEADAAQAEKETAEQLMQKHRKLVELTKQNAELQTKLLNRGHQRTLVGFYPEIVGELSRRLNFQATFKRVSDGRYGSYDNQTGRWDGMIGDVYSGDVVAKPAKWVNTAVVRDAKFFLRVFDLGVWLASGGVFLLTALLLHYNGRYNPRENGSAVSDELRCQNRQQRGGPPVRPATLGIVGGESGDEDFDGGASGGAPAVGGRVSFVQTVFYVLSTGCY